MRRLTFLSILTSCLRGQHSYQQLQPFSSLQVRSPNIVYSNHHKSILLRFTSFSSTGVTEGNDHDELENDSILQRMLAQYESDTSTTQALTPEQANIVRITRNWVKEWVIRHRLCPWAASVYSEEAMHVKVIDIDSSSPAGQEAILYKVLAECVLLSHALNEEAAHKTTLLVIPSLKEFDDFLDIHQIIEDMLPGVDEEDEEVDEEEEEAIEKIPLEELLQVATFHPRYVFADSASANSVENYTNRAPYPIFHLLSVREVARALDSFAGDPDDIWRRNVALMRTLGRKRIRAELNAIVSDTLTSGNNSENNSDGHSGIDSGNGKAEEKRNFKV